MQLVLDTSPAVFEVRRNSEWFGQMPIPELLGLFSMTTHAQLVARDMFRDRIAAGREIALHELTYPVLQGYDSFAVQSDLTIVGSDQLFNEMMGRQYQQRLGARPQTIITTVITPGLDGGPKQSKSLGNYVALTDTATDKFGKVMSLPDDLIATWATAYTTIDANKIARLEDGALCGGPTARDAKLTVAEAVVERYHGATIAAEERDRFLNVFSDGAQPEDIKEVRVSTYTLTALSLLQLVRPELSQAQRRRLIAQNAIRFDGRLLTDPQESLTVTDGSTIRSGKRSWARIRLETEQYDARKSIQTATGGVAQGKGYETDFVR